MVHGVQNEGQSRGAKIIDLLMSLLKGAVFHHGGVPENCPLALMGRFLSLMGRFLTLMGRLPECLNSGTFKGVVVLPGVGRAIACGYECGDGGEGSCGGVGGDSAVQSHSMGGVGGERRDTYTHTHRNTHTHTHTQEHTQKRTRECCTYPLATYPLKSARLMGHFPS